MKTLAASAALVTVAVLLTACGGKISDGGRPDAEGVFEPPLVPTEADRTDPILSDPALNAEVTSVLQPSYFAPPTEQAAPSTETFDQGAELSEVGTGDLTLLLVFDKSSSMLRDWNGKTRWQVANESLRSAIDGVLDELTIGAIRFPLGGQCGVTPFGGEGQVGFTSGRDFVRQWRSMQHRLASLGTPLRRAIDVADAAIDEAELQGRLAGRFRVALLTDGEPTCNDDVNAAVHVVATWFERGIETVVFGLPGSYEDRTNLDALATAGGTGQVKLIYTNTDLEAGLAAAAR